MALEAKSIFILCDTLNGYQPLSYFGYHILDNKYVETPNNIPNDYIHWLNIFNDSHGDYVNVLYPIRPKENQNIKVLYRGIYEKENEWKEINWKHGNKELFKLKILPLLKLEWSRPFELSHFDKEDFTDEEYEELKENYIYNLLNYKNEVLEELDKLYDNATFEEYQEKGKELDFILKLEENIN